jgi:hypothetical protein
VAIRLASELSVCDSSQLIVDESEKLAGRLRFPGAPGKQQTGNGRIVSRR